MKVWVVRDTEPVPMLTGNGRLMRAGMIAEYFAKAGHDVTWWASTWLHYEKRFYSDKDEVIALNDNLTIHMLHPGKAYDKHVSLARIRYCKKMQKLFRHAIESEQKPDLIYCSWPLIELAYECVRFGKEHDIPTIIDIRDLWPDIFVQPFPKPLKPIASFAVNMVYGRMVRFALVNATRVIAVIPNCLAFASRYGRSDDSDHVVYLSYKSSSWSEGEVRKAKEFWLSHGIGDKDFIVVYVGNIGTRIAQIELIVNAARKLNDENVKFVFCGGGPDLDRLASETQDCKNIVFAGYRNAVEIFSICAISKLGLLPYLNTSDFVDSLPNKVGEYLSFGLPLLTTLKGLSRQLVEENHCGAYFDSSEDLNRLIARYKSNPSEYATERENALNLFRKSFDADVVYGNLVKEAEEMWNCQNLKAVRIE